jgi:hypothetical protein
MKIVQNFERLNIFTVKFFLVISVLRAAIALSVFKLGYRMDD